MINNNQTALFIYIVNGSSHNIMIYNDNMKKKKNLLLLLLLHTKIIWSVHTFLCYIGMYIVCVCSLLLLNICTITITCIKSSGFKYCIYIIITSNIATTPTPTSLRIRHFIITAKIR